MSVPTLPALPYTADRSARPLTQTLSSAALAATIALRTELWTPLVDYREETRWTRLLEPGDVAAAVDPALHAALRYVDIWLLSWLPGQATALHDHGPSSGAYAVAQGTLVERVVTAGHRGRCARESGAGVAAGAVRSFGRHYVHQVRNASSEPAVSVHVYAPRLSVMNTYRFENSRLSRIGTEQAGVDW